MKSKLPIANRVSKTHVAGRPARGFSGPTGTARKTASLSAAKPAGVTRLPAVKTRAPKF